MPRGALCPLRSGRLNQPATQFVKRLVLLISERIMKILVLLKAMAILWFRASVTSKGELEKSTCKNIYAALWRSTDFQREGMPDGGRKLFRYKQPIENIENSLNIKCNRLG